VTQTKTVFTVPKMDCPSEERMVRMALDGTSGIVDLRFDLQARTVTVIHVGDAAPLAAKLQPLALGAKVAASTEISDGERVAATSDFAEGRTLRVLLAINAVMFLVEAVAGWLSESTGLLADSLDMLADALVYGVSLYAVGRAAATKLRVAHLSGVLQGALALGVTVEVLRRVFMGSAPEPPAMIAVSFLALAANVSCLALIARHRDGGAHMKASWIFSTNDVLANLGVIAAAALVAWTGSRLPDLAVGTAVALLVLVGAVRILRLR
jgi:Co/Zn/Cd efflux system component